MQWNQDQTACLAEEPDLPDVRPILLLLKVFRSVGIASKAQPSKADGKGKAPRVWCNAGGGAYQTLLKRVPAPGYPSRPDIAVHAVTIQVPLEGSLLTGGIAFVLKTGQQQWLACRAEGVLRSDFFISTQQVLLKTPFNCSCVERAAYNWLYMCLCLEASLCVPFARHTKQFNAAGVDHKLSKHSRHGLGV
jgi:hypothetical protein